MNVIVPTRLTKAISEELKKASKEKDLGISTLIEGAMKAVIEGKLHLQSPGNKDEKYPSSVSIDHDVAVAFKKKMKEQRLTIDKAIEQLVHVITNTTH